jgi:hypothetical protein
LKAALEKNRSLELILVINGNPDIPTYRLWQHHMLKKLGVDLDEPLSENPQIGEYNLGV